MCRQNQFWGAALMAFGAGVLIGTWVSGAFFCHCLGLAVLIGGYGTFRRK